MKDNVEQLQIVFQKLLWTVRCRHNFDRSNKLGLSVVKIDSRLVHHKFNATWRDIRRTDGAFQALAVCLT